MPAKMIALKTRIAMHNSILDRGESAINLPKTNITISTSKKSSLGSEYPHILVASRSNIKVRDIKVDNPNKLHGFGFELSPRSGWRQLSWAMGIFSKGIQ